METKYYSCPERTDLMNVIPFDGNYYEDSDIVIDVIGIVNLTPSVYDEEGNIAEEIEPTYSDFLFNIKFKTDKKISMLSSFREENPQTPIRKFL